MTLMTMGVVVTERTGAGQFQSTMDVNGVDELCLDAFGVQIVTDPKFDAFPKKTCRVLLWTRQASSDERFISIRLPYLRGAARKRCRRFVSTLPHARRDGTNRAFR